MVLWLKCYVCTKDLYSRLAASECTGVKAGWIRLVTPCCSETMEDDSDLNIHVIY